MANPILCAMAFVDFFAVVLLIGVLFLYFVHLIAIVYGKLKLHTLPHNTGCGDYPGVTMLKPLVGEDCNLYTNLKSCFDLNYQKLQVLFCVQDEHDPAIRTVKKLREDYPNVDVELLTCATTVGVNPKINNMLQGYTVAKYDLLWINDSSLYVDPNTLTDMVSNMATNVGIIHQVPFITNNSTFSGVLQKVYFGTQHARVYLFANAIGLTCTNGMSMLLRKHVLEEAGGLQAFSSYIAEDFFIGQSFVQRGWKIRLSSFLALQNPAKVDLASFFSRMVRWTRLRITMMPVVGVLEPFSECLAIGVLGWWAVWHFWTSVAASMFFIAHCMLWFTADQLLLRILQGSQPLPSFCTLTAAWFVREFWTYAIFFRGLWGRDITWKNGAFHIQYGGKAYLVRGMKVEDTDHSL